MQTEIKVLDHGFIALEASHAHDLDVVNAARVSYNKHHEEMEAGDDKLIGFLMRNGHGTPFESSFFRFRVKAPIFVLRQWMRNRVGVSFNEVSGRYVELDPEFYIPEPENVRVQVGKAGAYTYEPMDYSQASMFLANLRTESHCSINAYCAAIKASVAKEQARFFLPLNTYSEIIYGCNARSLMAWLSKRGASDTQWEHSQYAAAAESIFAQVMPITAAAFVDHGRKAP